MGVISIVTIVDVWLNYLNNNTPNVNEYSGIGCNIFSYLFHPIIRVKPLNEICDVCPVTEQVHIPSVHSNVFTINNKVITVWGHMRKVQLEQRAFDEVVACVGVNDRCVFLYNVHPLEEGEVKCSHCGNKITGVNRG